jgi:excisionase family DNA binding protein
MNKIRIPKFVPIKKVAERYDVSERTVQRWIKTGILKVHRFGKCVRISEEDLMLMEAKAQIV